MKKYDCKKNIRGITLIALIITIIILLILAVTSITLIINQGILDKSKNAILNQISIKYSCRIKKHLLFLLHE